MRITNLLKQIYNDFGLIEILKNNISSKETLQELGHILLTSISQNIYILNTIYSIIFIRSN